MNEVLAKRLLGACALVGVTLVLAKLLPSPQVVAPPEEHAKLVTYDLRPQPAETKIESVPAPAAEVAPPAESAAVTVTPPPTVVAEAAPPKPAAPVPGAAAKPKTVVAKAAPPVKKKPAPAAPPETKPEPTPVPAAATETAAAEVPAAAPAAPPAPAPKEAWYLQIGAFAYEANAKKSAAKLRGAGLQPHEDTITMKAGRRFRVRCGPFGSQQEAEQQKTKAVEVGFADARVARD
jgi:cell division septation protein DedD